MRDEMVKSGPHHKRVTTRSKKFQLIDVEKLHLELKKNQI